MIFARVLHKDLSQYNTQPEEMDAEAMREVCSQKSPAKEPHVQLNEPCKRAS